MPYPRRGRTGITRFLPSWRVVVGLGVLGVLLAVGGFAAAYTMVTVPEPNDQALAETTVVTYRDGAELGRFGEANRVSVPLDEVPEHVRAAVLAAEDRSFYSNQGVSPTGIARAFWNNVTTDGGLEGGSTITQQYVKNVYLTQERTLSRKLKEFVIALKVDNQATKDQILEDYLNTIYWGRGSYGVQTASKAYFGKDVSKVTPSEAAFLAGIIQAPGNYDPAKNREGAERRWNYVLDGMVTTGALTQSERDGLTFPKVIEAKIGNRLGGPKGYLLAVVKDELLAQGFTETEIDVGGLRVRSTFDRRTQAAAVEAVQSEFPTEDAEGVHAGLTAVRPGSGEVIAMYGGPDYVQAPGRNAALAKVQPGSTFKAFTLAAALEQGIGLDSRFAGNSPFELPASKPVRNEFDNDYGYRVDLREAIAKSINTAFVDLAMTVDGGPQAVLDAAVAAGIPQDAPGLNPDARITLGTSSVNTLQMAHAYATFAANGDRAERPFTVLEVKGANGAVRYAAKPRTEQAFDEDVAANVTDALVGVVEREDGTGTAAQDLDRPVAGKTGTHEDLTSWFVGYTPQLATAVAYYRGDGTQSLDGVGGLDTFFGSRYPAQTWTAFMELALDGAKLLEFPEADEVGRTLDADPVDEVVEPDTEDGDDAEPVEEDVPQAPEPPSDEAPEAPTEESSEESSEEPTEGGADASTGGPTEEPTGRPSVEPGEDPTGEPTGAPTGRPSGRPSETPTDDPTDDSTTDPIEDPTEDPTEDPGEDPAEESDSEPTREDTREETLGSTREESRPSPRRRPAEPVAPGPAATRAGRVTGNAA